MKIDDILKKLTALFKDASAAAEPDDMQAVCDKLAAAMAAYGDGAGLAADHPLHALKALHKEMTEKLATKAAAKEAADKAAAAEPDPDEDDMNKANVQKAIDSALVDVNKKLEAANKRAEDAEKLAKSTQDARELDNEKTTLRKFKHVTVDVEKDAPMFAKMRATDKPAYDFMMAKMEASEAIAAKGALLEADLGSPLGGGGQTAWAQIEAEAEKIVAKGAAGITKEKAIDQVMKNQPELVKRYKAEQAGAAS